MIKLTHLQILKITEIHEFPLFLMIKLPEFPVLTEGLAALVISYNNILQGLVAQWTRALPGKQEVPGSNPGWAKLLLHLSKCQLPTFFSFPGSHTRCRDQSSPHPPPRRGAPQRRVGGGGEPGCGCLRGKGGEEGGEGGEGETPSIGGRVVGDKPPIQLLKCAVQ